MRQRNDQDHELVVHTIPPQTVQPGDVIDWDDPVVGLTVIEDPEPTPEPAPEPEPAGGLGRARRSSRTTGSAQEG